MIGVCVLVSTRVVPTDFLSCLVSILIYVWCVGFVSSTSILAMEIHKKKKVPWAEEIYYSQRTHQLPRVLAFFLDGPSPLGNIAQNFKKKRDKGVYSLFRKSLLFFGGKGSGRKKKRFMFAPTCFALGGSFCIWKQSAIPWHEKDDVWTSPTLSEADTEWTRWRGARPREEHFDANLARWERSGTTEASRHRITF